MKVSVPVMLRVAPNTDKSAKLGTLPPRKSRPASASGKHIAQNEV